MSFSAGRPTQTSVPPRASEPSACSNGFGATAVAIAASAPPRRWIAATGSSSPAWTTCSAPSSRAVSSRASLMSTATTDGAGDARVLDGEVAEAAGAEDRDEVRRTRAPETFTAL